VAAPIFEDVPTVNRAQIGDLLNKRCVAGYQSRDSLLQQECQTYRKPSPVKNIIRTLQLKEEGEMHSLIFQKAHLTSSIQVLHTK